MADKLLTVAGWKAVLAKNKDKVKDLKDAALVAALTRYEKFPEDATSERRDILDELKDIATALKKDKAVAAAPAVAKYLGDLLVAVANARKKIEKDLGAVGMKKIDVQVIVNDWKGEPMGGYEAFVEFKAPGAPVVNLKQEIKGGVVTFNDVSLAPSGTMRLMAVSKGKPSTLPQGVISYDLPSKPIMKFRAEQGAVEIKKRAKSAKEATEKAGLKGTAGIEWKIITVGGEKTSETESKDSYEEEVEFVIRAGTAKFDIAKL